MPAVFGPWQTIWTWHRRMAGDGTGDTVLQRLLTATDAAGLLDWSVSADSTTARAHQHATNITRPTRGLGRTTQSYETSRLTTRSAAPAAGGAPTCTTSPTGTADHW
ncbi:hypothetical protein GCM10022222_31960 [Amycolatopsis ultiminotia]|uniref:Transposase n=1 Tax=Amycolatopsis ultiminotia TaxID=543629 RepID=A0ABP6W5U3_9PSEU